MTPEKCLCSKEKELEKRIILECIQIYKDLPALWNMKSKLYYDRNEKNKAYNILLRKYRTLYPNATRADVTKKFNVLRTNYRKECKKIKTKKCSDLDSTYKSTLWYFNALTFLNGQKDTFDVNISKFNETEAVESDSEYRITSKVKDSDDESRNGSRLSILVDYENSTADNSEVNTPKENAVIEENILHYPNEDLSEKKDEYYYWAISCASDLRKMESVQQIYAKKAIAEILMEGQLGLLHRNSMKLNNS